MKDCPPKRALSGRLCSAALLLLAGCAGAPPAEPPKIERLTGAALAAKLPAPVASVSVDDIVALTRNGESAKSIIGKIAASHSRYRLDANQIAALIRQGVALAVIDHIIEGERRRIFDDLAAELAKREQACAERVEQEVRQCRLQALAQPWPAFPFATCRPPHAGFPYWRCY